jgi:hypothetical protein
MRPVVRLGPRLWRSVYRLGSQRGAPTGRRAAVVKAPAAKAQARRNVRASHDFSEPFWACRSDGSLRRAAEVPIAKANRAMCVLSGLPCSMPRREARHDPADGRRNPAHVRRARHHRRFRLELWGSAFRRATRSASSSSVRSRRYGRGGWHVERLSGSRSRPSSTGWGRYCGCDGVGVCSRYGSHAVAASDQSGWASEGVPVGTPGGIGTDCRTCVAQRRDTLMLPWSHRRRRHDGAGPMPPASPVDGAGVSPACAGCSS